MKLALCILFAILVGACSKPPAAPSEKLGEVEIELERTECYGWCPAYSVKLEGNGTLTYTGNSYVKTKGEHFDVIDPQKLLPLLQRCEELKLLSQAHSCYVASVDNPHAIIRLRIDARARSTDDALVKRDDFAFEPSADEVAWHRKMCDLEEAIDAVANIEWWIGTAAERGAHREDWR